MTCTLLQISGDKYEGVSRECDLLISCSLIARFPVQGVPQLPLFWSARLLWKGLPGEGEKRERSKATQEGNPESIPCRQDQQWRECYCDNCGLCKAPVLAQVMMTGSTDLALDTVP
jgi:hypothetical protein